MLNQNEGKGINFTLNQIDINTFSFENTAHDFPQKIIYRKLADEVFVRVLGKNDEGFSFKMIRQYDNKYPLSVFEPFIGSWKAKTEPGAEFVNYRFYEWGLVGAIVHFYEAPHPDKRCRVISVIGWNPVEEEIQSQEHADWGNFVRVRYEETDNGVDRHMTVYNSTDKKIHYWISSWKMTGNDSFQSQAKEYDKDGDLIREWPKQTYHRIKEIPLEVISRATSTHN